MSEDSEDLVYYRTAERPDLKLWVLDDDDSLIDFSTGYTFVFKLAPEVGVPATFTKDTHVTGATGSGDEDTGTPNVTITFTPGELDDVPARIYQWQLQATTAGSLDRIYQGWLHLLDVIT